MAMIKSYTNLEQSKKLAEFLPLESADMYYLYNIPYAIPYKNRIDVATPCWSLAALFEIIPNASLHKTFSGRRCDSYNTEGKSCILGETTDSPIDACVVMVEKLHELKIL